MRSDAVIPSRHWAYFPTHQAAVSCLEDLAGEEQEGAAIDRAGGGWLLRAPRAVRIEQFVEDLEEWRSEVEAVVAVVERHGGEYASGWLGEADLHPTSDPT